MPDNKFRGRNFDFEPQGLRSDERSRAVVFGANSIALRCIGESVPVLKYGVLGWIDMEMWHTCTGTSIRTRRWLKCERLL